VGQDERSSVAGEQMRSKLLSLFVYVVLVIALLSGLRGLQKCRTGLNRVLVDRLRIRSFHWKTNAAVVDV
jgi:hypothetical protein